MIQIEILFIIALGLIGLNYIHCFILSRKIKSNEDLMYKIGEVVVKAELKKSMDNLQTGLENLFNPKDEIKKDVKKTRTDSKTK
jgi:hypothetical protein